MKKTILSISILCLLLFCSCTEGKKSISTGTSLSSPPMKMSSWILRDNKSATRWDYGYPVGNGSLGALSQGQFPKSVIYINEDTVWKSGKRVPIEKGVRVEGMRKAYEACLDGDYKLAEKHYSKAKNLGGKISTFQGLGDLVITHFGLGQNLQVTRQLDLYTGLATSVASDHKGKLRETILASYPDDCLAIRLETSYPDGLNMQIELNRKEGITEKFSADETMGFTGLTNAEGTGFHCLIRALGEGNTKVTADNNSLRVNGGQAITLIITVSTDHNYEHPRQRRIDDWKIDAQNTLDKVAALGWGKIKTNAIADHTELMGRFDFNIGETPPEILALTTPKRLKLLQNGGLDPDLVENFVQMGRYMLIGSSRPGSLPPNLQGLWGPGLTSAWHGDFHLNVNVQMNLWPANTTGLTECHQPFFQMLKWLHRYGKSTAASVGCRGYAACLASDPWGYAEFHNGSPVYDSTIMGGLWVQQHLMEYYRFTDDKQFLKEVAWPILQDGSRFAMDWLKPNPETGKLITGPGGSPENIFLFTDKQGKEQKGTVSIGNTYDLIVTRECLSDTLECAEILNIDNELTQTIAKTLPHIQEIPVNDDGRIGEWWKPFKEPWRGHRHKSHLYALYPGSEISKDKTPKLFKAAYESMKIRTDERFRNEDQGGGGATGWNLAWSGPLWARLQDGDKARMTILDQMRTQVNENLFNRCNKPFQIDGNCGVVAGMVEMLAQSHETDQADNCLLRLLPALPAAWEQGHLRGIYCRGGFVIEELVWQNGKLKKAVLLSMQGGKVNITCQGKNWFFNTSPGERIELSIPE